MSTQPAPFASQRCHCSVSNGNGLPVQVPVIAFRLFPTAAGRPPIVGLTEFVGRSLRMGAVGLESTGALLPTAFVAVTRTRIVRPAWASVSLWVGRVAPATFRQLRPAASQRRHWLPNVIGVVPSQ